MSLVYITVFSLIRQLLLCCYRCYRFPTAVRGNRCHSQHLCGEEPVKIQAHIGGGQYVSVTSGYTCVDFRSFYVPYGQMDVRLTNKGTALRLHEWANIRPIIDSINNDFPILAGAIPCYMQTDQQDVSTAISCRECFPFPN